MRDPAKARERKRRYLERRKVAKYGPVDRRAGNRGPSRPRLGDGFHSAAERLSKRQRAETPIPFRDLLLSIARHRR